MRAMIIDDLCNYKNYHFGPAWEVAFNFLSSLTIDSTEQKYQLQGDDIFAQVMSYSTHSIGEAVLEAHRSYVDIQMLITGRELIGVMAKDKLTVTTPYHKKKDVEFYEYSAEIDAVKLQLSPDRFAMFLPQDAHMPCLISADSPELVKKVVVKIRRDLLTNTAR